MKYSNKKWFTLIELMISVVIISMWFFWIIAAIKSWINFMEKTRKEVIAINMARSWMEMVYNIRDTNRTRRTSKIEECWLKIDPMKDDTTNWCEDDDWFATGNWGFVVTVCDLPEKIVAKSKTVRNVIFCIFMIILYFVIFVKLKYIIQIIN